MKRFWKEVSVERAEAANDAAAGFRVALDGRAVRTQGGADQIVPNCEMAEALAAEWRAQSEEIEPGSLPHRDLADFAIDIVRPAREGAIIKLLGFAETDTLCYRADPDEALFHRQQTLWEPLLVAFEERHQLRFERISGILHRPHPPATMERLGKVLEVKNEFELSALHTLASLASSLCVGMAALEPQADAVRLFAAANCEEDWQAEQWGWDMDAEKTRAIHLAAFEKAARFADLVR